MKVSRIEFNQIAIAEAKGDMAAVAKMYEDAAKRKIEALSSKESKAKNLHVEGMSGGTSPAKSPRNASEAIHMAINSLR